MAEKLSITIALNGAEEIKRQLADVGQAGKDCFNDINKAAADVGGFNKLDPSVVTEKLKATGVAGNDVAKVLTAVNQAGRMETLVNGIAAVENGLVKVQTAASALDGVLLKGLTRSLTMVGRLLPAAFAAAVVGSISTTTRALLELDAAAIKLGVSVDELGKARDIFKQLGIDSAAAAKGVADFSEKMRLEKVKEAAGALDEFGRQLKIGADWMKILRDAAAGTGEAADLARKKLEEMGRLDTRLSPAAQAIDNIKKSAMSLPEQIRAIIGVLQTMGNTAERNRLIFQNFSAEFGTRLIQSLDAGTNAAAGLSIAWQKLRDLVASGFGVSPEMLSAIAVSLNQIRTAMEAIGATDVFQGMTNVIANMGREINGIINLLSALGEAGFAAMKNIERGAIEVWNTIIGWIDAAIQRVRQFFGMGGGQAAGAGARGMAHGGLMGGRGSGTSDSNLAWLSRGEHIMPANAVRQPGVLQLLEALRRSGGNLRSVLDRMGHFALGGLVGAPAFAGGGMSNVTIQFPGLQPIAGLRASSAVVDELRRSAALAQVRSGGRKPSRYT